jgi:acetyltransferase-like isoleucine patch superfamily enzyme
VKAAIVVLPWPLKRRLLSGMFGYDLDPTSYIGLSWVYPHASLRLGPNSRIGHGTVCRALDEVELGASTTIGNWNWLTGRSTLQPGRFFTEERDRRSRLIIGPHAAITMRHYVDCTNSVEIGAYSTVGGVRSVIMTHEIDVRAGRQSSKPIRVGEFCYLGTGCIVLPGTAIPDRTVIAAGAVVRGELAGEARIYGGIPARPIADLPVDAAYFKRERGVVE